MHEEDEEENENKEEWEKKKKVLSKLHCWETQKQK